MANTLLRWLIPGLVAVGGGTAVALAATGGSMTSDLLTRGSAALSADSSWAHIELDGRDAVLTGTVASQAAVDQAVAELSAVPGIGLVTPAATLAERVSPYPFSATLVDGKITLAGGYPTEEIHKVLLAAAGDAADSTKLLGGAPDPAAFSAGAVFAVATLKDFDEGSVQLADLSLTIKGRARSAAIYEQLQDLGRDIPPGITLATASIVPPLASPYVWTASYDGTGLRIAGDEPDAGFADHLRAAVPPTIPVDFTLTPSSGEPSAFEANALSLLGSLLALESGEVSITDQTINLTGSPASGTVADQVIAAVTVLGGTARLDAPQAADFALTISKSASGLSFVGGVPDKATRQKLAAMDGADVTGLELAHGAPAHFAEGLQFGLDALAHLQKGQVDVKGNRLSIGGTAATVADFKAVSAMLAQGPEGFTITAGALHPPLASPYIWSANKAADGTISMAGFIPDDAARTALEAKISNLGNDLTDPGDGAPQDFVQSAGKGLDVLVLLDSGKVSFDGATWSIEGSVDSVAKASAADAVYSSAGLRTAGWSYVLRQPSLPAIAPYIWRAQKTAGGAIEVTGYAPDEAFQQAVKAHAAGASDETTLGAGAPADFSTAALAGLDALDALQEGVLGLDGSSWSLGGTVADSAARDAVEAKLGAATNTAGWSIAITAKDSAPVVQPYLWSATKTADGSVALTGYVPSGTVKSDAARRAGKVGGDTTTIASGEPAGFSDDVAAGLDALAHLSSGRAMFDGSKWSLAGDVASQAQGDAAVAVLSQGGAAGIPWNVTLAGYVPSPAPLAASSVAPSAEPSAPMPSSDQVSASDITSVAPLVPPSSAVLSLEPSLAVAPSETPSQPPSASEAPAASSSAPSEASSAEPPPSSSVAPSSSASAETAASSASSSEEPPAPEVVFPPMPETLTFEAALVPGGQIALKGSAPTAAAIKALAKAAGGVPAKNLTAAAGLPDGFTASATGGIAAVAKLGQGHLGFDGSRWWLRADAYTAASRDAAVAAIAAVPGGGDWSVGISVLAPLDACRTKVAAIAKSNAIQFTGRAALTKPSIAVIDDLATMLEACAATNVHVQGHTDSDGNAQANLGVSVARAEAVVVELVKQGVDESRLYAEGFGESDPIASNDTKAGKAANRRVVFEIDPQ